MTDFTLPQQAEELRRHAADFAEGVLGPAEREIDQIADPEEAYRSETFKKAMAEAYEMGLHKMVIPERCGGLGVGPLTHMAVVEEIAARAPGLASTLLVSPITALIVAMLGLGTRHDFYRDYLEEYVEDRQGSHSSCWAVTEPNLGSDLMDSERDGPVPFSTRARKNAGGGYLVSGAKSAFVSNGWRADSILLMLACEGAGGEVGPAAFLIPADLPGISRGRPLNKLGLRALNQSEIFFDEVEVPDEFLLVPPEAGQFSGVGESIVTSGNTSVGILAVAVARAAFEAALGYARERRQGGTEIVHHQLVKMKLFEAHRDIEAARLMLWKSAWLIEEGRPDLTLAFSARHFACSRALTVCAEMVQVFGGYGISKEYAVEKCYRDIKLLQIMDGTLERVALTAAARLFE
jgi:alkylation response protein AidB-like acyl-CoA dehydrogenase